MITSAMFVNWVKDLSEETRYQGFSPKSIEWVDLFPACADEADIILEKDTVIICASTDEAETLPVSTPVVVVAPSFAGEPICERRSNVLFAKTKLTRRGFTSSLQKHIRTINRWEHDLDKASADGSGYQEMLSLSRDILGNLVTISDSTYRLLAYTPDMPTDDPITNELIENGFHGEQAIARFQKTDALSRWAKQQRTHYSGVKVTQYPSMNHVFKINGAYFIQMVMTCTNVPFSQGLMDTFDILVNHVKAHIRRCQSYDNAVYSEGTTFLSDLIEGKPMPGKLIAKHARQIGLSDVKPVRLYAIKPKAAAHENLGHLCRKIKTALTCGFVIMQSDRAYLVAGAQDDLEGACRAIEATLSSLIDFSCINVAASSPLPALRDLSVGARQTSVALEYSEKKSYPTCDNLNKSDPFSRFEDYLFDYLLFSNKRDYEFLRFCLDTSAIARMREHRPKKQPSDEMVLRSYLRHESNAAQTAEALDIHRNTVLNRINDISKREHLDLGNPRTRLSLTAWFHLFDLLETRKETV